MGKIFKSIVCSIIALSAICNTYAQAQTPEINKKDDSYKSNYTYPYMYLGKRIDISVAGVFAPAKYKATQKFENYMGVGASIAAYLVLKNRKNALGAAFDFSQMQALDLATYYYSFLAGPAYSFNFSPFGKVHVCLDIAAGYMFKRNVVYPNLYIDQMQKINKLNIHSLGFKTGISFFKWSNGIPCEYRIAVKAPCANALFSPENDRKIIKNALGNEWEISIAFGARFGNY